MSIFIDTGIFSGAYNIRDRYHTRAKEILRKILEGHFGHAYTSDYIFDETLTLAFLKTKNYDATIRLGHGILESNISLLYVDDDDFIDAWNLFKRLKKGLSFTDCTSLVLIRRYRISRIASFDTDFDGLVERVF